MGEGGRSKYTQAHLDLPPLLFERSHPENPKNTMQHFSSIDDVHLRDVWLSIGAFDGVHKGHRKLIHELVAGAHAEGVPAVVFTFYPHPAAILRGRNYPFYLNTPEEKAELLGGLGVDVVITHPFNRDVANTSAYNFILDLNRHLNIRHLQLGYDFALGKNRDGDISTLQRLGEKFGYTVEQTQPVVAGDSVISSSRIRFLLGAGQVEEAALLLGRNYKIQGLIEIGEQRGRTLGFPTANLAVWSERILPTAGVYACRAAVRGKTWGAVTNIGVRPTFEPHPVPPRVETHLLDFDADIYGESIQVEFVSRLRAECRFPSIEELVTQIKKDVEQARGEWRMT